MATNPLVEKHRLKGECDDCATVSAVAAQAALVVLGLEQIGVECPRHGFQPVTKPPYCRLAATCCIASVNPVYAMRGPG